MFCLVSGDVAWRLYDTYGFPLDLTHLMVEEKGMDIDMKAYEEAKKEAQVKRELGLPVTHLVSFLQWYLTQITGRSGIVKE